MTSSLATYISLPGQTAEAMTLWHEIFGGELTILRYGDVKLEGMPFTPDPQSVAHSTLILPNGAIAAGDSMDDGTDYPIQGTAYSLLYTTDTPEESKELFNKLAEAGGTVNMPFSKAPWGDWYGQVFDRFGVMWSFSSEGK
ncbi:MULTISPECIES: VOC family protein [Kocuria]|uniref:VOC family protein n=1 Tax=Kocuria TaxID=57493 RepID=UPI00065FBAFB|nr:MULTISPECIES: VOC family protein [Kocuria]MCT1367227.1 VOC family protein [Rothia sp. p3-SID1597]RUQ23474.1 VOC family protein [Kocuria sp. HSID16901]